MKCPYCGRETEAEVCEHCKAQVPAPKKPKKPSEKEENDKE
jgi:sarcosine oxidase delta subunit